ncbi:MAG: hypothetical protein COB36_10230 [Alphaproteobacteria bacterium]|nr:MAG: hypothetical protein COB36_10230 [Alphaproteobacteria bacterium]
MRGKICIILMLLAGYLMLNMRVLAEEVLALTDVAIVDIKKGLVLPHQTVLVENGEIIATGPSRELKLPVGANVRDLHGMFLIPGLWDMHIHPEHEEDLDLLLVNGVLGTRILMGEPKHLKWRAEIELGMRLGPKLLLSGPIIEGTPPPGMGALISTKGRRIINTREEAIAEVRAQHDAGFDYLKVYNNLPVEAYQGLIEEGQKLEMQVIGHVPMEVGLYQALEWGQTSVEHLRGSIQLLARPDASIKPGRDLRSRSLAWEYIDTDKIGEIVDRAVAAGAYHDPTLMARLFFSSSKRVEAYLDRPEVKFLQPQWRFLLENRDKVKWLSNFSEADFISAEKGFEMQHKLIQAFQSAGVPLLAGTDMGPWGFSLHDELGALVHAGLTPQQALVTATINPARFAGLSKTSGYIGKGARADLVVLRANPLKNIKNTRKISAVIVNGKFLDRMVLDKMLKKVSESPQFGRVKAFEQN